VGLELSGINPGLGFGADHGAEALHIAEDAIHRAVVADPDFDPALDQRLRDVGLDVREADREVGLERQDLVQLRADERRHAGLLLARAGRAHGEARDADDALLFAERIEHLGGLLGQADNAFGQGDRHGVSGFVAFEFHRAVRARACCERFFGLAQQPLQDSVSRGTDQLS
jgi:hypothetical protein